MHSREPSGRQAPLPTIGINAHLLSGEAGYRRAGIHQYIYQVLRQLASASLSAELLVYARHMDEGLAQAGLTVVTTRWPTEKRSLRIVWEQVAWPWHAWRQRVALLHSLAFVAPLLALCPTLITVYDLSFIHFPERFPWLQRHYLRSQTRRSCRRATAIITISESSRQDVHRYFDVPLQNIAVVYPGVDAHYRPLPVADVTAFRREKGLGRYVLHVGTLQPRKNIPLLLEAFSRLTDRELKLVLVGGKGWQFDEIFERIQQLGLTERVCFPGYVPDAELPLWYNAAELFVFPSVYEGFGMPVVEAMACGTPVVAADSSSIPEAAGEAGCYFAPDDAVACAERMTAVLRDPELSAKMRAAGLAQASQFSWERAGRETADVYRTIIGNNV